MTKANKIIYWIATIWLGLGMTSSSIVQLVRVAEAEANMVRLGYPSYMMTILGVWKALGVIVILAPKLPVLKEWAYAGFFFVTSGAAVSHIVMGDGFGELFPSLLLLTLTIVSWYFRPDSRRLA
jgi:hypothetical protein